MVEHFDSKKRELLKGAALTAAGLTALNAGAAAAKTGGTIQLPDNIKRPGVEGKMLVNTPRAYAIMEEMKIDGLIALNPINVYYLTNSRPVGVKMRWEYPAFATFARDPKQPSFLVTTSAQAWDIVNGDREVPQLIAYTGASNWRDYVNATPDQKKIEPKAGGRKYPVLEGVKLTDREQRWMDSYNGVKAPTPAWALVKALKESGLTKGRIAVDDMRVKLLLEEIGQADGIEFVPGDNVFRHIRMVKSEAELALHRIGGRNNQEAAEATIKTIEAGMTFAEIEHRFRAEAAARGNDLTFILAGVTLGLFPDGKAVKGKPFLIDAVSSYKEYHGDFGRMVCIGEPNAEIMKRAKASKIGREAAFSMIKAGKSWREVEDVARQAQIKAGMPPETIISSIHTVGLQHSDHPSRSDVFFGAPMDHVLEENMVITLDLPHIHVGWGAGHNEDLIRITKTGFEAFGELTDPLVVI
ncbi:MAG: aminopeptidase P family protein [Rhodospirillaceae bacterium]|nr:aminopeptidase P family protein [Rhodospirillaceae bacterium]